MRANTYPADMYCNNNIIVITKRIPKIIAGQFIYVYPTDYYLWWGGWGCGVLFCYVPIYCWTT
jgi:hypothetical protein